MTVVTNQTSGDASVPDRPDLVSLTIDGVTTSVPKGTLIIRAAEQLGVAVPRFCDHPLLDPVAACRMCLIEVEGMPKPQPACAVLCSDGMVVKTQMTSAVAEEAQRSVMEFLLINHPLDCPICDKGGECPLQNQAMTNGQGDTRFDGPKRTFPKPINLSAQVLLDRERCVSCAARAWLAAAGGHRRRQALQLLLLGQHDPDLSGRGAHQRDVPLPVASVRPRLDAHRL
jgi:NADH-quinone oxidoreductase subunit G